MELLIRKFHRALASDKSSTITLGRYFPRLIFWLRTITRLDATHWKGFIERNWRRYIKTRTRTKRTKTRKRKRRDRWRERRRMVKERSIRVKRSKEGSGVGSVGSLGPKRPPKKKS